MPNSLLIRFFDLFFALLGMLVLSPFFLITSLIIVSDSRGGVFYRQVRVGKGGKPFRLYKFRSMHTGADRKGMITVGGRDPRITRVGGLLRKYKLDELPQLINVLRGEMSLVGPRPEVPRYVEMYSGGQRKVLEVKPGITDNASVEYADENELLGKAKDPEKEYVEVVMPRKIELNMHYINNPGLGNYFRILFRTFRRIVS
jgi:lipopolysaccharide/colanic/teichoic acid biosynthesis glycosyltransferase